MNTSTSQQHVQGGDGEWWLRVPAWLAGLAIVLLTAVAYLPVLLHGGFVWDDTEYLTGNPLISPDWRGLLRIWEPLRTPQYYPLVFTSFWIEHNLWGTGPDGGHVATGYHVTNVLLHAANGVLAWRVFQALGARWAWLIGALFALHPVHVESAAWIAERKNVLSAFFYLLAARAYLRFADVPDSSSGIPQRRWRWYAIAFLCFTLALLSKTVTCSLPAALVLALLFQRRRITAPRLVPLAPMFALGLAMGLVTAWIERRIVGLEAFTSEQTAPIMERLLVASRALGFYPCKLLLPWPLTFNYPRWEIDPGAWLNWLPLALVLAAAAVLAWSWRRGWRGPFLSLSFYAGTIFPAVGIVYVFPHRYSFVADHFCYLASLGVLAAVVALLARVLTSRRGVAAVVTTMLGACGALTWLQGGDYRDEEFLWHNTLTRNSGSWMAHNNLAALYSRSGDSLLRGDLAEAARPLLEMAAEHAARATELKPGHHGAHLNRAGALHRLARHEAAVRHYETGIRLVEEGYADKPEKLAILAQSTLDMGGFYRNLAADQAALGLDAPAEEAFRAALKYNERDAWTLFRFGEWLFVKHRATEAETFLQNALRLLPARRAAVNSGGGMDAADASIRKIFAAIWDNVPRGTDKTMTLLNTVRLRLAREALLPEQSAHRDLRQARLLIEAVQREAGGVSPELLALEAAVALKAGRTDKALELAGAALAGTKQRKSTAEPLIAELLAACWEAAKKQRQHD